MSADIHGFDDITLIELSRRRSYKWRAYPDDVLPAFVAELDFRLAPPVAAALREAADLGDCGYAWADPALAEATSDFAHRLWSWDFASFDVTPIPDVMSGVLEMLRIALRPGDGVVINTPAYPPFFSHIGEARCRAVEAPLQRTEHGHALDLDALEGAFRAGARAYLMCNPHNPTGLVLTREELLRVADLAERYDVLVLSDEIHAPLVFAGAAHVPYLSVGESAAKRGIAFVSASKAWNIPGLKCAQMIAVSDDMHALVGQLNEDVVFRVGHLGVAASIAAYRDGGEWLDKLRSVLDRNRTLFGDMLSEWLPAARYAPPRAGYLAWVDCSALDLGERPADAFLERGLVAFREGTDFGAAGTGFVRATIGTSRALLREIVERMRAAVSLSDLRAR